MALDEHRGPGSRKNDREWHEVRIPTSYTEVNRPWELDALEKINKARNTHAARTDPRRAATLDWLESFVNESLWRGHG